MTKILQRNLNYFLMFWNINKVLKFLFDRLNFNLNNMSTFFYYFACMLRIFPHVKIMLSFVCIQRKSSHILAYSSVSHGVVV
jgi:hypothetical protein